MVDWDRYRLPLAGSVSTGTGTARDMGMGDPAEMARRLDDERRRRDEEARERALRAEQRRIREQEARAKAAAGMLPTREAESLGPDPGATRTSDAQAALVTGGVSGLLPRDLRAGIAPAARQAADIVGGPLFGLPEKLGLAPPGTRAMMREDLDAERVQSMAHGHELAQTAGLVAGLGGAALTPTAVARTAGLAARVSPVAARGAGAMVGAAENAFQAWADQGVAERGGELPPLPASATVRERLMAHAAAHPVAFAALLGAAGGGVGGNVAARAAARDTGDAALAAARLHAARTLAARELGEPAPRTPSLDDLDPDVAPPVRAPSLDDLDPDVAPPAPKGEEFSVFHGSPRTDLTVLSSVPETRQFDNATSALGVFFSPTEAEAGRYAGKTGRVYPANVRLTNPKEMRWGEFGYFQNINKGKNGESLPAEQWGARAEELKAEAVQLREALTAQGFDGIVVRNTHGMPVEVASFNDVPLAPAARFGSHVGSDVSPEDLSRQRQTRAIHWIGPGGSVESVPDFTGSIDARRRGYAKFRELTTGELVPEHDVSMNARQGMAYQRLSRAATAGEQLPAPVQPKPAPVPERAATVAPRGAALLTPAGMAQAATAAGLDPAMVRDTRAALRQARLPDALLVDIAERAPTTVDGMAAAAELASRGTGTDLAAARGDMTKAQRARASRAAQATSRPPGAPPPAGEAPVIQRQPTRPGTTWRDWSRSIVDGLADAFMETEATVARLAGRHGGSGANQAAATSLARRLELAHGSVRGAGGLDPTTDGTFAYNSETGGYEPTGAGLDHLQGLDDAILADADDYMAAQRHLLDLVPRQARAAAAYAEGRAKVRAAVEATRRAKDDVRRMHPQARAMLARELQAARAESRADTLVRTHLDEEARAGHLGESEAATLRAAADRAIEGSWLPQASKMGSLAARTGDESFAAAFSTAQAAKADADVLAGRATMLRDQAQKALRDLAATPRTQPTRRGGLQARARGLERQANALDVIARRAQSAGQAAAEKRLGTMPTVRAQGLARVAELRGTAEGRAIGAERAAGRVERVAAREQGRHARASDRAADQQLAAAEVLAETSTSSAITDIGRATTEMARTIARRLPRATPPDDYLLAIDPRGTAQAEAIMARLDAKYKGDASQLDAIAQADRDWYVRSTLVPLKEAGMLSDDAFTFTRDPATGAMTYDGAMLRDNAHYTPYSRLQDVLGEPDSPRVILSDLRGIHGGLSPDRPITGPRLAAIAMAKRAQLISRRQIARNMFADAVDASPGLQTFVKPEGPPVRAGDAPPPSADTFPVYRNGALQRYKAAPDVIRALHALPPRHVPYAAEVVSRFMQAPARMVRTGVTLTPKFIGANLPRDLADMMKFGPASDPVTALRDLGDAYIDLIAERFGIEGARADRVKAWRANAGALADMVSFGERELSAATSLRVARSKPGARRVLARATSALDRSSAPHGRVPRPLAVIADSIGVAFDLALAPAEGLLKVTEEAPKVGAFNRMRKQGVSALEAGVRSRDIGSPDFQRKGWLVSKIAPYEAFVSPEFSDLRRTFIAFRDRPGPTALKFLAYSTVPAVIAWARYKDEPDYQARPLWESVNFLPVARGDDHNFIQVPRPLGLASLATGYAVEKALDGVTERDPMARERLTQALIEGSVAKYAAQPMNLLPSAVQPAVETGMSEQGFATHFGRDIVPPHLQDELPERRYMENTTNLALVMGRELGVAPLKVDYLIRQYGGGIGQTAAEATGTVGGGGALSGHAPGVAADLPFVSRYISPPAVGMRSTPVADLERFAREARQADRAIHDAFDKGDIATVARLKRDHPEYRVAQAAARDWEAIRGLNDDMWDAIDAMPRDAPDASDRRFAARIYYGQQQTQLAANAMRLYTRMLMPQSQGVNTK